MRCLNAKNKFEFTQVGDLEVFAQVVLEISDGKARFEGKSHVVDVDQN